GEVLADLAEAKRLGAQAVLLYNNERPHTALGYATPEAIHHQPLAPDPQAMKGTPPGAPPQTPGFIAKRPDGWRGTTEGKGSRKKTGSHPTTRHRPTLGSHPCVALSSDRRLTTTSCPPKRQLGN